MKNGQLGTRGACNLKLHGPFTVSDSDLVSHRVLVYQMSRKMSTPSAHAPLHRGIEHSERIKLLQRPKYQKKRIRC